MKRIIIFSIISAFLSFEIHCTQDFESALNSSTENRQSMEYIDTEENDIQTDSYHQHNQEDAQLYNSLQENVDYVYEEPRNNLKPIPITYGYPNNYKLKHNKYTSTLRNPYIRTRYQPYSYMPSNNVYSYPQKRPPALMWDNHHVRQQPVYANLYWRKIVYPYPSYSGQNANENIGPNSFANPNTAETKLINRRYMSANPKRYYRYRNYYRPAVRTANRKNLMTGFYPIPRYTVRRPTTYSSQLKPNTTHFSSPSHYKRKRKVKPMNQISIELKPQWLQDNSTT
jgi:hypothetical protein